MNNIFRQENYRGTGDRTVSGVTIAAIVMGIISVIGAVLIIANFGDITARIAIWMEGFLTSGFPILLFIGFVIYLIARIKWRIRRSFWGW